MGFGQVMINAVPMALEEYNPEDVFSSLLSDAMQSKKNLLLEDYEKTLYTVACKAAIKGGQYSTDKELEILAQRILRSHDIMYCPHGRPVAFELTKKELEKQFKDAEIVFLGLSVDGEKANWEKMVKGGSMSGTQLYLGPGSSFQTAYNIKGIPRFILLDKEGVIISNDMTRPSAPETVRTLEALEGISSYV